MIKHSSSLESIGGIELLAAHLNTAVAGAVDSFDEFMIVFVMTYWLSGSRRGGGRAGL